MKLKLQSHIKLGLSFQVSRAVFFYPVPVHAGFLVKEIFLYVGIFFHNPVANIFLACTSYFQPHNFCGPTALFPILGKPVKLTKPLGSDIGKASQSSCSSVLLHFSTPFSTILFSPLRGQMKFGFLLLFCILNQDNFQDFKMSNK